MTSRPSTYVVGDKVKICKPTTRGTPYKKFKLDRVGIIEQITEYENQIWYRVRFELLPKESRRAQRDTSSGWYTVGFLESWK